MFISKLDVLPKIMALIVLGPDLVLVALSHYIKFVAVLVSFFVLVLNQHMIVKCMKKI